MPERPRTGASLESLWSGSAGFPAPLWKMLRVLHRLPWPLGERALGVVFVIKAFAKPDELRRALAWASAFARGPRRWRLAFSALAMRGRFVARGALIGMRSLDDILRQYTVVGQEHIRAAPGATILLGFHFGPPYSYIALRATGRAVTLLGLKGIPDQWTQGTWDRSGTDNQDLLITNDGVSRATMLHRAQHVLRQGGTLYVTADTVKGVEGREAFRLPIHGRDVVVKSGWLALHRTTGATVLPVLAHLHGRSVAVTIHPPLPMSDPEACRATLEHLLVEYAGRFPEQCWSLAV